MSRSFKIPDSEVQFSAIRAQGAGGQNVNKVSSAIHLSFDIRTCSLPESVKNRLLTMKDSRISRDGVINIKAQEWRTQAKNKEAALNRLHEIVALASTRPKRRKPTKPTAAARQRRLNQKIKHGRNKVLRGPVRDD